MARRCGASAPRAAQSTCIARTANPSASVTAQLASGLPQGKWQKLFAVPKTIAPFDLEVDSRGRIYLSDPKANKVHQLSRGGKLLRSYGQLDAQNPGSYDPLTFISPGKLAT